MTGGPDLESELLLYLGAAVAAARLGVHVDTEVVRLLRQVGRWSGCQVDRWTGGQVVRWWTTSGGGRFKW